MLWVTFGLIAVLGGATIWFHNPTFIKWKPSVLYWAMALAFWLSQAVFRKNLLQTLIGEQLDLPTPVWQRLNLAWIAFFGLMGVLNLYVAYSYSTSVWATFKAFGVTGLMLVFMVAQGFSHQQAPDAERPSPAKAPEIVAAGNVSVTVAPRSKTACALALQPSALEVLDDSHLHAGHAGAREGRHFSVRVVSARFNGLSRGPASPRI